MSVRVFKLVNGELVVGNVEGTQVGEDGSESLNISSPLVLQTIPAEMVGGQQGQTVLHFAPFIIGGNNDEVIINTIHVIADVDADEQMAEQYNKIVNPSSIVQPDNNLVIPQ